MRAIFWALVVMNLVVFGSQFFLTAGGDVEEAKLVEPLRSPGVGTGTDLRLLSERDDMSTSRSEAPRPAPGPGGQGLAGLPEQPLCLLVGPFGDQGLAQNLIQRLEALELQPRLESVEVPEDPGYWVYLPPELSQKAALRKLHELQSKNIDSYIIPRGELALGISLGMFSRAELARQRREELVALGYEAQIQEMSRSHRELWVALSPSQAAQVADQFWLEFFSQHPELEKRQNFCPGVASGTNFH